MIVDVLQPAAGVLYGVALAFLALACTDSRHRQRWIFVTSCVLAPAATIAAWAAVAAGQWRPAAIQTILVAINVWLAWKTRPPRRKRRPSRVAARVKDLGHRLVIAPAPTTDGAR